MFGPFKPAPHIAELPAEKIDSTYKRLRWQVFAGIFFGYAAYYFVRANFDLAQPGLIQAGLYSKAELGVIGSAAGLAYGLSKFVMAGMSDRSNPRVFLPFGLLLSGLCFFDVDDILEVCTEQGLKLKNKQQREEWCSLLLEK